MIEWLLAPRPLPPLSRPGTACGQRFPCQRVPEGGVRDLGGKAHGGLERAPFVRLPLQDVRVGRIDMPVMSERRPALRSADLTDRAGAMLSHASDGAALRAHPAPDAPLTSRWETLITISLDLEAARLEFHEGGPCGVAPATWQSF